MLDACAERNVTPLVTFSHITLPRWVNRHGGHAWDEFPERFTRFCDRAAREYRDQLGYVLTLNEPDLTANLGYRFGNFPGTRVAGSGDEAAASVTEVLIEAHHRSRDAIRAAAPNAKVGLSLATMEWSVEPGFEDMAKHAEQMWEGPFYGVLEGDDFLGVNAYTRLNIGPERPPERETMLNIPLFRMYPPGTRITEYGYEFRPEAVAACAVRATKLTGLPVIVTENGVPASDDRERVEYVERSVPALIDAAHRESVDLRGYFYWSLLDNFEWNSGYTVRFGLCEVDPRTFERRLKPSAHAYAAVARKYGADPLLGAASARPQT
jgi:beta-glucosidase